MYKNNVNNNMNFNKSILQLYWFFYIILSLFLNKIAAVNAFAAEGTKVCSRLFGAARYDKPV